MLNIELIDNLYAGLTKERQQNLCELLFKKSKQNMNYFRRTKDISLSKLETLADFFCMPLDFFRINGKMKANNVNGDNNQVGNIYVNSNLIKEIEGLRIQVTEKENQLETQKNTIKANEETIRAKEEALKAKDDLILLLREQVEMLKAK